MYCNFWSGLVNYWSGHVKFWPTYPTGQVSIKINVNPEQQKIQTNSVPS